MDKEGKKTNWTDFGSKVPKEIPTSEPESIFDEKPSSMRNQLVNVAAGFLTAAFLLAVGGFLTMYGFGIIADQYSHLSPGLGFVNSIFVFVAVSLIVSTMKRLHA